MPDAISAAGGGGSWRARGGYAMVSTDHAYIQLYKNGEMAPLVG